MLKRFFELTRNGVPLESADRDSKAHKGGGGSQTVSNEPPTWAIPHLNAIGNMAGQLATQPGQYYPGSTVVPFSRQSQQAMRGMEQFGKSGMPYATTGMDSMQATARGDFLEGNPYLDSILNKSMDQTNAMFQGGGRYGSAGHAGAMASNLGGIRYQNYADERQNQMDASKFLPMGQTLMDQMKLGRLNATGSVGNMLEGKSGEYQQDAMNRWDYSQNEPWNRLSRYAGLITPGAGLGGTQTTTLPGGNRLAGALGGGMTGAMMGSMIPGFGAGAAGATGLAALGPAGITLGLLGAGLGAFG